MLGNGSLVQLLALSKKALIPLGVCLLLVSVGLILNARLLIPSGPPLNVSIVQGNIDQYKKWDKTYEDDIVRIYSGLTFAARSENPDLIVWPETAVPGWIPTDERYLQWLQDLARDSGSSLMAGAVTRQGGKDYNGAFLFDSQGNLAGHYLKQHLVPFGEYVPLRFLLGSFTSVLNEMGEFSSGPPSEIRPYGINICFEDLFPDFVRRSVKEGAQIVINMTNDGWYGETSAPEQHFAAAVLRAVETRRWFVRATNTGISGFINPQGQVVAKSVLMERTVLRGKPQPLSAKTFYVQHGDLFALLCTVVLPFFWFFYRRRS
jgi:apolipoprotein N-acyltransferase